METRREVIIQASSNKWLSSPVTTYKGPICAIRDFIPKFERRSFGPRLLPVEGDDSPFSPSFPGGVPGYNLFYDTIVRQPIKSGEVEVPVGVVSKQYTLVQHQELFDETIRAIEGIGVKPSEILAELDLTVYGERMRLGVLFPDEYGFEVKKNDKMKFRLECFNSVDGSMRFLVIVGWLRLVCSNGMVAYEKNVRYKSRHNQYMELKDIAGALHEGIAACSREKDLYQAWAKKTVSDEKLQKWIDDHLAKRWGVKAAARTWHITRSGHDVILSDPFEKGTATQKTIKYGERVPGSDFPVITVYAVSQALSWLAKERRDVQEQLEWKQQIPDLVRPLLGKMAAQ